MATQSPFSFLGGVFARIVPGLVPPPWLVQEVQHRTVLLLNHVLQQESAATEPDQSRQLPRHGFEIVDKRSGKEVYLDGSWAEMFQKQIMAWQQDAPTEEEVEDILDRYTGLAQQPVVVH